MLQRFGQYYALSKMRITLESLCLISRSIKHRTKWIKYKPHIKVVQAYSHFI
jgi:hypothetical protein